MGPPDDRHEMFGLRSAFTALVPLLLVLGCTETSVPAEWEAPRRETTPAGFTRVSYASLPVGPVFELGVVTEIGGGDGIVFGLVGDVALTGTNEILVLDTQSSEIRRFDASGAEGEPLAGPGAGPGELGRVNGFAVDRLGGIWVVDWGNFRMQEFAADGTVRMHPFPIEMFAGRWDGGIADDGRLWFRKTVTDLPRGPTQGGIFEGAESVYVVSPVPGSEAVDSVWVGRAPILGIGLAQGRGGRRIPFTPQRLVALDPRGSMWTGRSDEYRLVNLDMNGDTLLVIDVEATAPILSERERQVEIEMLEEWIGRDAGLDVDWDEVMPRSKPIIQHLVTDDRGNVWVQRSNKGGTAFDVFTPAGDFLARFEGAFTPWPFLPPVVRGDRLVTVLSDSLDVHTVLVVSVPPIG